MEPFYPLFYILAEEQGVKPELLSEPFKNDILKRVYGAYTHLPSTHLL
jgi:hypothetical protein